MGGKVTKIGIMVPSEASPGIAADELMRAAQIACHEVNEAGGLLGGQLELVVESHAAGVAQTTAALRRLAEVHRCAAVIGHAQAQGSSAPLAEAMRPVVLLNLSPAGTSEGLDFHFTATAPALAAALVAGLARTTGPRVALVVADEATLPELRAALDRLDAAPAVQLAPVRLASIDAAAIDELLDRVQAAAPHALVPLLAGEALLALQRRIVERGLHRRIAVGLPSFNESVAAHWPPELRDGLHACQRYFMSLDTPPNAQLLRRLSSWPGVSAPWPQGTGLVTHHGEATYLAVHAFAEAARRSGDDGPRAVAATLAHLGGSGPGGEWAMSPAARRVVIAARLARCDAGGHFELLGPAERLDPPPLARGPGDAGRRTLDDRGSNVADPRPARPQAGSGERRLNFLLASSPAAIYTRSGDPPHGLEWISPNLVRLVGWPAGDALAEPDFWLDRVHPDDRAAFAAALQGAPAAQAWRVEYRFKDAQGGWRWLLDEARMEADAEAGRREIVGSLTDVTAPREAALALSRSEAWLRQTQAIATIGSWRLDLVGDALEWSAETSRLFGHAPQPRRGTNAMFLEAVHPDDRELLRRASHHAIATGTPFDAVHRILRADGELRWVHERGEVVYGEDGRAVEMVGAAQDITGRVQLEQELRALNEQLERRVAERSEELARQHRRSDAILRTTADGFYAADGQGRFLGANPAYCALLGYTEDELRQRHVADLLGGDVDAAPLPRQGRYEAQQRRKDGSLVDVELSVNVLDEGDGVTVFTFVRDITARKQAEAALRQARDDAERASQAKTDFLSGMSHELRTPMNAILGFSQLLQLDPLEPAQRTAVDEIFRAGEHLLALIDDLLDLARIEAGKLTVVSRPVDLGATVAAALKIVQPLVARSRVRVDDRTPAGVAVDADPVRLRQVLVNLLSNAAKYNREGGRIDVGLGVAAPGRVRLQVRDTGPGLTPDDIGRLFRTFERLGAERSGIEGTGIGLALSRQLAERMGGQLGVDSAPGEGSTFWIDLRASAGSSAPEPLPSRAAVSMGAGHTVLYVEDNAANLLVVEALLQQRGGWHFVTATRGDEGLETARRLRPDLILLDIQLPGMDGFAVLSALRADPALAAIPVIALTADAMPAQVERGLGAGFFDYLPKPLDLQRLLAAMERALAPRRGG